MGNFKMETVIEHLSNKGYHIAESWLRDNKNKTLIPELERVPIVCNDCGYTREITASGVCQRQSKNPCPKCRAQKRLDRKFGADHIKILEYSGEERKPSKLYCTHSEQVFERKTGYLTHSNTECICSGRFHTWKEVKNVISSRGYEALDSHKDEDIIGAKEKLTVSCEKHGTFYTTLNRLNRGSGCKECGYESLSERNKLTKEEAQNKIDRVHGKGRYVIGDDYIKVSTRCTILCTSCGKTRLVTPNNVINGRRCPCETESYGESFLNDFLDYMGLRYEKQAWFTDCRYKKPLPFDFKVYNPDGTWFLLEFDGKQHFSEVPYWGGKKVLRETRKRDRIKNRFCKENKIFLIRIQKKNDFKLSDRERVVTALRKVGYIMAFFSKLDRKHPWVISIEI